MLKKYRYIDRQIGICLGFGTPQGWRIPAHSHNFLEFLLISDGRMKHFLNGTWTVMEKGDMLFIRARDVHCYRPVQGSECSFMNLAFVPSFFNDIKFFFDNDPRLARLEASAATPKRHLNEMELAALMASLREIHPLVFQDKAQARRRLKLKIADILLQYFLPEETMFAANYIPDWLCRTCLAMKAEANFIAGLPAMKKLACRSKEHLTRSCRKYLRKTPTEYINQLRLEHARIKLLTGDDTVSTIALDSGFHNLSHFLRLFRKMYGQPPARYRKAHNLRPARL